MRNNILAILIGLVCLIAPWASYGSDFQQQQSTLYPFNSSIAIQDDFVSGSTTSGSVGALGFNSTNGATTYQASIVNRPGILRKDTTAVINTVATLHLSSATALLLSEAHSIRWAARLNTNDANTTVRLGIGASVVGNPPNDGIYFEKLDADTNWFCVTRAGAVQTRTDSGVAVSTSFADFLYKRNATGVQFILNQATVCTHSTNVPTVAAGPFTHIINSAATAKTIDFDYFQLNITSLVR